MRVLLIAATTGYQTRIFSAAARALGLDLVLATDRCHVMDDPWGDHAVAVRFDEPADGIEALVARGPFDGVAAVGDVPAYVAALAAKRLGLRFSSPAAVLAAKNKFLARQRFRSAGLLTPGHELFRQPSGALRYPCVLKPLGLSGSRGVIRANDAKEFATAFARIKNIAREPSVLVEDFIPGHEYALEGMVTQERLQVLALFNKPDPLDGPFFEETIYVTVPEQDAITQTTQRAIAALGLTHGPVHAEMRVNDEGVWMLEVAARPIGGLCSRVLKFSGGKSLEELILRHAMGEDVSDARLEMGAHAVMMIPIPRAGVYTDVAGLDAARAVDGVEDIVVTAKQGQAMLPLPEGASYLGFIFARGATAERAVQALRDAHACLTFDFAEILPVVK
ncbi:MAG TPA: ATP-grasp domain-containing protein [Bryobacteraceae bacterium]|nr:ATP-grasp domain-containing protein [Bryobacteraceae bacterium]